MRKMNNLSAYHCSKNISVFALFASTMNYLPHVVFTQGLRQVILVSSRNLEKVPWFAEIWHCHAHLKELFVDHIARQIFLMLKCSTLLNLRGVYGKELLQGITRWWWHLRIKSYGKSKNCSKLLWEFRAEIHWNLL